jgi:hypothetical protein
MKKKHIFFALVFLTTLITFTFVNAQNRKGTFTRITANAYSPGLYSDKIDFQILLVNLPGVDIKGSTFEGSYKTYFMPEGELEKLLQGKGGVIDELSASDINNKTLINSGKFNKSVLGSSRLFEKVGIPFKSKVPDNLRTMVGKVIVFYSIKIYDAKLKKTVFKDSSFMYSVYEGNTETARKTICLSFFVNENGKLYTSSLARDKSSTSW